MFRSRFIFFTLLLWLSLSPSVRTARNSYESLYSGSGYALQTDSGNPPYSVAGRFVVSMRRSYFNVAGERSFAIVAFCVRLTQRVLQRWAVQIALAEAHRKTCAGHCAPQA